MPGVSLQQKTEPIHDPTATLTTAIFPPSVLPCPTPLKPFRVIAYLALHCLEPFVSASVTIMKNIVGISNSATSCTNTAVAVMAVFLGKKRTQELIQSLAKRTLFSFTISLPSNATWTCKVESLFDGAIIQKMDCHPSSSADEKERLVHRQNIIDDSTADFLDYVDHHIDVIAEKYEDLAEKESLIISDFEKILKETEYKFNCGIIRTLYTEIKENNSKIQDNCSFAYCIGIAGSYIEEKDNICYEHMFVIEQLLYANDPCFRLYQSCIDQATLLEDCYFQEHLQHKLLSFDMLSNFLTVLQEGYCLKEYAAERIENCFGYKGTDSPLVSFEDQTLKGVSVRYLSASFDPNRCVENTVALAQECQELYSGLYTS